jgi:hypothetical protein
MSSASSHHHNNNELPIPETHTNTPVTLAHHHSVIKVPYSKNPVFVADGYKPPVVVGRSFEYETSAENAIYWSSLSLAYRQYLKKEADIRQIDIRLLIDERRNSAFKCSGCMKPMVMREIFTNGDRFYQCLNPNCVKRIIRWQYQARTGRVVEVA